MARDRLDGPGGRTAVITGAGSGLGRALSLELARLGWKIGAADVNESGARETVDLVERAGGSGEAWRCDVTNAEEVAAMASHFFREWGTVGLLVNNAGIAVGGFVGDIELAEWRRVIDVNLLGAVNGCHEFVPRMKAQGGGWIINIASSAGINCLPEMAPYNVTKASVISLSETLRAELSGSGIGVTVACPTFFDTNLLSTMSCTDPFQEEFVHSAFSNSRMTAAEIAMATLRAARRGKLYVMPQFTAKWSWAVKRITPAGWCGFLSFGCRAGIARPVIMWMSRHGLV